MKINTLYMLNGTEILKILFDGIGVVALTGMIDYLRRGRKKSQKHVLSLKINISILIVDSRDDCSLVALFNSAGYYNVKSEKDIVNSDAPNLLDSSILFVRATDVGMLFAALGIGLASSLKERHRKKKVVVYDLDRPVDPVYRNLDGYIFVWDESFEFIRLADRFVKEIFKIRV
jgi:hypothetical protein